MVIQRFNQFPEGSGSLSNDDIFLFMDDPASGGVTKKISLSQLGNIIGTGGGGGGGNPFDQNLNTTDSPTFNLVSLSNNTTLAKGTFDNSTGGQSGISLNCYVGYELNWQGGHLKSTQDNGVSSANIYCDSPIEFIGSGIDNVQIDSSGITYSDGTTQNSANISSTNITDFNSSVSGLLGNLQPSGDYANTIHTHIISDVSGLQSSLDSKQPSGNYSLVDHTHSSSDITDFNSSVSGLLPTIANSGDNRILTSTGSSFGINAESNLTFDGTNLSAPYLLATYSSGDEGGEIQLAKPPSGTLSGGITIDAYQNKLRFFEQGGSARGFYLDLSSAGNGVSTNLATNIVAGSGISVTPSSGTFTINSTLVSNPVGISGATAITNIVQISQTDYDNLPSYDPNTVYIINT